MSTSKKPKIGTPKDLKSRKTIDPREAASVKGGRKSGEGQRDFIAVSSPKQK